MSASPQKPKPGLATAILLPLAIWVVTGIAAIVFIVLGFTNATSTFDDFARFPADEAREVRLNDTGGYRIWLLRDGVGDDYTPGATATVTGPDGQDVPVSDYVGSLTFSSSGTDGTAVLTFDAEEEGVYTINASPLDSLPADFAVGKANPLSDVGRGFLLGIVVGSVGFLVALILFIVMLVRRGRSKKRIFQSQGGFGGGYGPQGGYGAPSGFTPPPPPSGFPPPPAQGGYPPPPPPGQSW